tara:strand:+ start:1344 stop:2081 length:738 start_codon:yes stop_codon:yes gene_type:complete
MIKGRYTPWDESALKLKTFEIQRIEKESFEECLESLQSNSFCKANLIYGRFPASDFQIKELLFKSGYIACETSFRITLGKLNNYELPWIYTRRKVAISLLEKEEFYKVTNIASDMFKFSRFHEDPFIPKKLSNDRITQWINDLANQNVSCLVSMDSSGDVISFMIFSSDERNQVELILGGSKKGSELHSPFFWGAVIEHLKNTGVKRISTTISAANSGVLSLYQNLGFKIIETNTDYHKHIAIKS